MLIGGTQRRVLSSEIESILPNATEPTAVVITHPASLRHDRLKCYIFFVYTENKYDYPHFVSYIYILHKRGKQREPREFEF